MAVPVGCRRAWLFCGTGGRQPQWRGPLPAPSARGREMYIRCHSCHSSSSYPARCVIRSGLPPPQHLLRSSHRPQAGVPLSGELVCTWKPSGCCKTHRCPGLAPRDSYLTHLGAARTSGFLKARDCDTQSWGSTLRLSGL